MMNILDIALISIAYCAIIAGGIKMYNQTIEMTEKFANKITSLKNQNQELTDKLVVLTAANEAAVEEQSRLKKEKDALFKENAVLATRLEILNQKLYKSNSGINQPPLQRMASSYGIPHSQPSMLTRSLSVAISDYAEDEEQEDEEQEDE